MTRTSGDRIVAVRTYLKDEPAPEPRPADKQPRVGWLQGKVANPMTKYAEFRDNRQAAIGPRANLDVVVEVESASGHLGHAVTSGGLATAAIVEQHLEYLVVGESAAAHGRLWDRMFCSTLPYGRKGLVLHAISGVDIALWDLHGKIAGMPVHALLGGKIRDAVRVYATGPEPSNARALGFAGAKLPLTFAPCEGETGFRANVEIAAKAREALPAEFPIMYDCWMSLDVDYAARLAQAVSELGVRWIEEPLPPDDYGGLRRLRDRMPPAMMLATGEHEYTAKGFRLLCEAGVDVLQPDPAWCGGLTELLRISAVAETSGVKVIPHTGGMVAYHFAVTRPDGELAEFLMSAPDGRLITGQHAPLFIGEVLPVDGWITPNDAPGFGLTLDADAPLRRALPQT